MADMTLNSSARIWTSFKELQETVELAVLQKDPEANHDLEALLTKHKPDFVRLLKNPAKNSSHREALKKSNTDGLLIQGQSTSQSITEQFIGEACIISDLFDLNEFAAAELLMTAEVQLPQFPGLTRGLVAVLLYYDGRRSVLSTLSTLIQCRNGRYWTSTVSEELVTLITAYTDDLMKDGLISKILELMCSMDLTKELDMLENERGLGSAKHRRQVSEIYNEIKSLLVECLFNWSCQSTLSKQDTLEMVKYLKLKSSVDANGCLSPTELGLLMCILCCIDASVLDQEDDGQELIQMLPLVADNSFVPDFHKEICSQRAWPNPGVQAVIQFAWSQTLRALSQYPDVAGECEEEEYVMDCAIQQGVFRFLRESVVAVSDFHKKEFFLRRIHELVTYFISHMPLKVKELRNRGDEEARIIIAHHQEGLEAPASLRRDFVQFLLLIGDMYGTDPLRLELASDYWCPQETSMRSGSTNFQPHQKQLNLFKFVRLAGDLVPPLLYTPYIKMLTGLANGPFCAHYCFGLLKANGKNSGGHSVGISWDHFFGSLHQYYTSLRQEVPTASDMHVFQPVPRSITTPELEGLVAFLDLAKRIASMDEKARIALCENQQWSPLVLLVGLTGCSVPALLKGKMFSTLAAFAQTPDIAASIWQLVEVSQVVASATSSQFTSLKVEIDEVETRNEEFPITLGFLELVNVLTDIPIPTSLGSGCRAVGFDPYLNFIIESIFLQFDTRSYKNPTEQWDVSRSALQILYKLVLNHVVESHNFSNQQVEVQGSIETTCRSPGHAIMILMLNDDVFLRKRVWDQIGNTMQELRRFVQEEWVSSPKEYNRGVDFINTRVLYIIEQAVMKLEEYSQSPGQSAMEESSLLSLQLIEVVLEKQSSFFTALRESGSALLVSGLDKLLLTLNSRTNCTDHLSNITRFVTHNSRLPQHALYAIRILYRVCHSGSLSQHIVSKFTVSQEEEDAVRHGFVECLEAEDDSISHAHGWKNSSKLFIMKLLLSTLDQPSPNMTHFLLGYELRKAVAKTNLQDPGILGAPRTCLHSIITILDGHIRNRCVTQGSTEMAELGYRLIYGLCANKETSSPTLRYLRTAHDFLFRHLQHVPFSPLPQEDESMLLGQQSWLLKTVALELRLTSVNRQRSHSQRMIDLLFQDKQSVGDPTSDVQARRKILRLLDSIDFCQIYPVRPLLQFFDPGNIENLVNSLKQKDENGRLLCDIQHLYHALSNNINISTSMGQRPEIIQEVQLILKDAVCQNALIKCISAKRQSFEAWRQVVEVVLTTCPSEILSEEARQNALFEILQELFVKVSKKDIIPELAGSVSGVTLTLVAILRQCFVLNDTITLAGCKPEDSLSLTPENSSRSLFSSSLQVVLKGLIEQVISASGGQQRVRANLYGAVLYCLQIAKPITSCTGNRDSRHISTFEKLEHQNISTILSYGDSLMDVVCRDSCDGHHVGRMIALACLDAVIASDSQHVWISYLISKGYLQHLVDSLLQEAKQLEALLHSSEEPLKALYIFQSKLSLMSRVASSSRGSTALLQCVVMERLGEFKVLDLRPNDESSDNRGQSRFHPDMMSRYRQILYPVIRFCLASLTSLGSENKTAEQEVLKFIMVHTDLFCAILGSSNLTDPGTLEDILLSTALICRVAVTCKIESGMPAGSEYQSQQPRIERLLLSLLPKCLSLNAKKDMMADRSATQSTDHNTRDTQVMVLEIVSNVITYCTATLSQTAQNSYPFLFGPTLHDSILQNLQSSGEYPRYYSSPTRHACLGVIVCGIQHCSIQFTSSFESHKQCLRKLNALTDLSTDELKELSGLTVTDKMSSQQRQQVAKKHLLSMIQRKEEEIKLAVYIIESSLLILWRHLQYYLVTCASSLTVTSDQLRSHSSIRKLQGDARKSSVGPVAGDIHAPSGVNKETIDQLRTDVGACINDSLYKKLQEIEQCYARRHSRFGFMEALVRRIKRLLTV